MVSLNKNYYMEIRIKEQVHLKTRKLVDGNESIYLDIIADGKRKREFLKLYLHPGTDRATKKRNEETLIIANAVKSKRILELQNGRFDFEQKKKEKVLLVDWMYMLRNDALQTKSANYCYTMKSTIMHLEKYTNGKKVYLDDVDKKFVLGFIRYMRVTPTYRGVPLGKESIYTYYMALCIALNKAVKNELINKNPCELIPSEDKPKRGESNREYLTLEEVKMLINTECRDIRVKRMFLFACFTGLRYKDIFHLRWKNIKKVEEGVYQIEIIQQKTKTKVVIPLSDNALQWLPERYMDGEENRPFVMPETSCAYDILHQWTKAAGIKKHVTFHVGRHTYATLLLYYGADLYTVSKLLGHTNVKTTQIYAKVMDETKRVAVNLIPNI